MSTVSINRFLSSIDFKQVACIQAHSPAGGLAHMPHMRSQQSTAVVFVDGTILLTGQPLRYFRALAHGHMLDIPSADGKAGEETVRLVPLDAIHHLELVSGQGDEAELSGEGAGEPAETCIVYRTYDPACPERRFQIPVPASLIDDLMDRDEGSLIDIGGGRFVFANEVENARPLEPRNIARLAQCEEGPDKPPVSIIELTGGAFIPSPIHAQTVEGMVQRPLPSVCMPRIRCDSYREAGL